MLYGCYLFIAGTYDAVDYQNSCILYLDTTFGDFKGSDMWNPKNPLSEDCLFLNLWVPRPHRKKRAVMVCMSIITIVITNKPFDDLGGICWFGDILEYSLIFYGHRLILSRVYITIHGCYVDIHGGIGWYSWGYRLIILEKTVWTLLVSCYDKSLLLCCQITKCSFWYILYVIHSEKSLARWMLFYSRNCQQQNWAQFVLYVNSDCMHIGDFWLQL